jgi:3',5'-cyclic AMP phosphodiesterase CpdA
MLPLNRSLNRLLCSVAVVSLCFVPLPVSGQEEQRSPGLTFVHISDIHVCNLTGLDSRFIEKRKHFGSGPQTLKRFLDSVPTAVRADAVVVTGDLVDFYEAQAGDGTMRSGEIEAFAQLVRSSAVPLWLVTGNHDLSSFWFEGAELRSGQHNAEQARATWIRNVRGFENGTWYSLVRRVGKTTYRLIILDNAYGADVPGDLADRAQLAWLNWQLAQGKGDTNLIFMHIPLTVGDTNGDGIRFNAPPPGWPFPDTYRQGLMKILNENPSVAALFVGHQHRNVIEDMPFPAGHRIAQIQTGNLQMDPANWRVVLLKEDEISVSVPGSGDTKAWKQKIGDVLSRARINAEER